MLKHNLVKETNYKKLYLIYKGCGNMDVKKRMIKIVETLSSDFFNDLKPTEMVFKLMLEYIKVYEKSLLKFLNRFLIN